MKRAAMVGFSIALFGAGSHMVYGNDPLPVLSAAYVERMDTNKDSKVSRSEFVDCGVAALKKQGKKANLAQLHKKFEQFDRNGDDYITAEDPAYKDPVERISEQILGTWSTEKTKSGPLSFVFKRNGVADLIRNGNSFNERSAKPMKYRFVHPGRTPVSVEIVADQGEAAAGYYKCIIEFLPEDRMKLCMNTGTEFTAYPDGFSEGPHSDTLILDRTAPPEPLPAEPAAVADSRPEDGVHRGTLQVKAKTGRSSDRQKETVEKPGKVAGTLQITTTKKIKEEIQSLSISLSNIGPRRDTLEVRWFFLCHPFDDDRRVRIYDQGSQEFSLEPRRRANHSVTAETIRVVERIEERENPEIDYFPDPVKSTGGDVAKGYVVLLMHNGVILEEKSNSKDLLTDFWRKKFLAL
jgi:hypothetical protein